MGRRHCTCPADGATYCAWCQFLAQKAGISLGPQNHVHKKGDVGKPSALRAALLPTLLAAASGPQDRYRSKTERRFVTEWLEPMRQQGVIRRWWYEPCKGLFLAPQTSYTPDFLVEVTPNTWVNGVTHPFPLVFFEVKGAYIREKDWLKAKQAAALYPCFRFVLVQWKQRTWLQKEIPAL